MQKKLIALAIAAAFSAPAFADVTMYGVADAVLASVSADGQKSDMQALSGGLAASRLGAKAVQDLDNGMKVVAVLEYGLDTQTGTGLTTATARQQMLAVAGGFGTVATGYLQTTGYDFATKFDPTAGSFVSPLQSMTRGGVFLVGSATVAARAQRALAYISPDMGGVTVAVNYSTDTGLGATGDELASAITLTPQTAYANLFQTVAPATPVAAPGAGNVGISSALAKDVKIPAYLVSVNYAAGPLAVGGVIANAKFDLYDVKIDDVALGGSYDLGAAKLFATYQTTKLNVAGDSVTNKAMSLSAVAPVGPGAVAFSYAKLTMDSKIQNSGGNGLTLAWLQGLSKTTTLYAGLEKVSNDSATNMLSVGNNALGGGLAAQGALVAGNPGLRDGGSSQAIFVGLNNKF